jgi:hypothetical protein
MVNPGEGMAEKWGDDKIDERQEAGYRAPP